MQARITRRPAILYVALTFAVSWGGGWLFMMATADWAGRHGPLVATYLPRLIVVAGPASAACVTAYLTGGREAAVALVRRLRPLHSNALWWGILPLAGLTAGYVAFLLGGASTTSLFMLLKAHGLALCAHFALQVLMIGVGEELGWRGWLLPHLARRRTLLHATLITGAVWLLWHGPVLFGGVGVFIPFTVTVFALSLLFAWLLEKVRGDVFVLALAHGSVNTPFFFVEQFAAGAGLAPDTVATAWAYVSILYGILACFALLDLRRRALPHECSPEVERSIGHIPLRTSKQPRGFSKGIDTTTERERDRI
ncbi:MAG TPA: type II CAAX endopeptidase family protein [Rhodothermales bacterium]|nr:type II CAAX endopeptidase family protein [Rhodothermales bacterium]